VFKEGNIACYFRTLTVALYIISVMSFVLGDWGGNLKSVYRRPPSFLQLEISFCPLMECCSVAT
jgi:hypothetical protein